MSDKKIRNVLIKLDSELFDRLDQECKRNRVSKVDLLRGLIEYYLETPEKPVITITKTLNMK